uniref:Transmembrane protein 59-like n=1 Tax=Elaeophora elaphi TaxID=1147741 RepID=A0A0R3RPK3_9BILA
MYGLISLGFLLLLSGAQSQEECFAACTEAQTTEEAQAACKEGCRLQVIFAFASNSDVVSAREDCYNGCIKSYQDDVEKQACSFGCDKQPDMKKSKIRISITNKSPTFQVARGAMEKMMHRISNSFPSLGEFGSASSEELGEHFWEDPFAQFHFHMQNEMARLHQIAQNVLNLQRARTIMPVIAKNRPEGHEENAMEGFKVGNNDKNGEKIMEVKPVESNNKEQRLLGYEGENPSVMEVQESSLLSQLASRARRLSVLSQWLVCVALFLCFVSMLSISVAILKQIKSQKYLNLRNMHSVVPPTFAEPLAAKKIPLESAAVVTDYPLIHDSPPPAYDQLSVHKEKPENADNFDPKV